MTPCQRVPSTGCSGSPIVPSDPPFCVSPLSSSFPGTLHFEQQVLLNPVIAISDEEIKATQQFWGPEHLLSHLSLYLCNSPSGPLVLYFYRCPTTGLAVVQFQRDNNDNKAV